MTKKMRHIPPMQKEIAALFKEKGYAVETRPYDTLMFRSLVHSGRFDLVLLEKRVSP